METTDKKQDSNKKSKKFGSPFIAVASVLVFVGVVFALLVVSGRIGVTFNESTETAVVQNEVCGTDKIERYNEILGAQGVNVEELAGFSQQLLDEDESSEDPNCLFMMAQGFAFAGETDKAADAFKRLQALEDSTGNYASGKINSLTGLRDLSAVADPGDFETTSEGSW